MIIIGSGSRDYKNIKPIRKVLDLIRLEFPIFTYYHGAQRGFDTLSSEYLKLKKHKDIEPFEAEWDKYDKAAGMIRNKAMLNAAFLNAAHEDIMLIAMPLPTSIGTYGMIGISKEAKIQVRIYDIEGNLTNG